MIHRTTTSPQKDSWQTLLANCITDPKELLEILNLDPALLPPAIEASHTFALRVPRAFVNRMRKGDINDPLLRQILPLQQELQTTPGFSADPLEEKSANPIPGLLHKYPGRVLLTLIGVCGINCRYCFRRHFPYEDNTPGKKGWDKALAYIAADPSIHEIIFSGGEPLVVPDRSLADLIEKIALIPHIHTLRFHTRMPIVIPERITDEFLALLTETRLQTVIVLHSNHPNEIDASVKNAIQKLRDTPTQLLNQSVLLKGVNDSADCLIELSQQLFAIGVLPYYLHLLDKVQGTAHFDVNEAIAKTLVGEMMNKLPGYLIPRLVREEAGMMSKTIISVD